MLCSTLSSDRLDASTAGNAPFVAVRQAVAAMMDMGVGYAGFIMVPMSQSTYTKHMHAVTYANKRVVTCVLEDTATTIRHVYQEIDPLIANDAVIDLVVSFDGSWMTREHKSAYGIDCVDTMTGLCVDLAVYSLYCQRCSYSKRQLRGRDNDDWFEPHHDECNRNFDGTSGNMEAAAAEVLWERSVDCYGFRW